MPEKNDPGKKVVEDALREFNSKAGSPDTEDQAARQELIEAVIDMAKQSGISEEDLNQAVEEGKARQNREN